MSDSNPASRWDLFLATLFVSTAIFVQSCQNNGDFEQIKDTVQREDKDRDARDEYTAETLGNIRDQGLRHSGNLGAMEASLQALNLRFTAVDNALDHATKDRRSLREGLRDTRLDGIRERSALGMRVHNVEVGVAELPDPMPIARAVDRLKGKQLTDRERRILDLTARIVLQLGNDAELSARFSSDLAADLVSLRVLLNAETAK